MAEEQESFFVENEEKFGQKLGFKVWTSRSNLEEAQRKVSVSVCGTGSEPSSNDAQVSINVLLPVIYKCMVTSSVVLR